MEINYKKLAHCDKMEQVIEQLKKNNHQNKDNMLGPFASIAFGHKTGKPNPNIVATGMINAAPSGSAMNNGRMCSELILSISLFEECRMSHISHTV